MDFGLSMEEYEPDEQLAEMLKAKPKPGGGGGSGSGPPAARAPPPAAPGTAAAPPTRRGPARVAFADNAQVVERRVEPPSEPAAPVAGAGPTRSEAAPSRFMARRK